MNRTKIATPFHLGVGVVILTIALSAPSQAQPADCASSAAVSTPGEKPWSRATSQADQEQARAMYRRALDMMKDGRFTEAGDVLRSALARWQHPNIRLHLAKVLLELGRPAEAHDVVSEIYQYGPAVLGCERHRNVQDLRTRLQSRVARLVIRCDLPGATITIDGKMRSNATCGREIVLDAGEHQLVVEKQGHKTITRDFKLVERDVERVDLTSHAPERHPWVKPVFGVGTATAAAGAGLWLMARGKVDTLETQLALCPATGCIGVQAESLRTLQRRANRQRNASFTAMTIGAAVATVSGAAWLYFRSKPHELRLQWRSARTITATPVLTPGFVGLTMKATFR